MVLNVPVYLLGKYASVPDKDTEQDKISRKTLGPDASVYKIPKRYVHALEPHPL